ncbi:Isomerase YbhE [Mycena sanguinolenta]|uniref:Isomerase YbhE n=1 Tax=Mycena sanguinolenta TaxID=230812 RepID=A0A8H7CFE6_9AGAR|nr:Isomerase YbhE [Mycena sanguinolenta]
MVKFTIYTGGYTSFIVSYLFDTQTASLTYLDTIATTPDPSWITPHPTNPTLIYAVNEVAPLGALQVYETTPGGGLTLLDQISSGGNGPAFCAPLSTGQVAIMNYGSGNGEIIPTVNGGTKFDNSTTVLVTFPPPFNGTSNPHMAYEHGNEVFVPDLGGNKVWRIGRTGGPGDFSIHGFIPQPLGTGPRHMAILDDTIYLLHETANLLTAQLIPPYPNGTVTPEFLANATTVPDDVPAGGTYAAAELLLSPTSLEYPHPLPLRVQPQHRRHARPARRLHRDLRPDQQARARAGEAGVHGACGDPRDGARAWRGGGRVIWLRWGR